MRINAKEKNLGKILSVFACLLAALSMLLSVCLTGAVKTATVAEDNATYMEMETEELPWDGTMRRVSGIGQIYGNGNFMDPVSKPVMTVVHFPAIAEVKLNTVIRKRYTEGTALLRFRIVHEHASTGLNEVIYPRNGGWLDLNAQLKEDGSGYNDITITDYVSIRAGDKLKMIVDNVNGGGWCTAVLGGGLSFIYDGGTASGLSFIYSSTAISYTDSDTAADEIPENLQAYFGAGAVKSDLITYEYIKSYS